MDQVACILAKLDIPAQQEMLLEHACLLVNGVETTSVAKVLIQYIYSTLRVFFKLTLTCKIVWNRRTLFVITCKGVEFSSGLVTSIFSETRATMLALKLVHFLKRH